MKTARNYTSLDFDSIKNDLKEYLKTQDKLRDYNYDGAVISLLLDVLAYNTMTNAVYANMSASERFLSTAQLRSSVVSLAKNLGYLASSVKSAKANITLSLSYSGSGTPSSILLPINTKFTSKNSQGVTLQFSNREDVYLTPEDGNYTGTFDICEGRRFIFRETFVDGQRGVVIPNSGVDIDSLKVSVLPSVNSNSEKTYEKSKDYTENLSSDSVYFIEEVDGEMHRVYFGDDIIGKEIQAGNVVKIEYDISSGTAGNDISAFTISQLPNETELSSISVNSNSTGGSDIEDIESIRNNAPKFYQSQNRAVTARDYEPIVRSQFSDVLDVSVWGGETATPPSYGKVFIGVMGKFGVGISATRKTEIENILKNTYSVMTIDVDVVDPKYIHLVLESNVKFSTSETSVTASDLKSQIISAITSYNANSLSGFGRDFRMSVLANQIDVLNSSISANTIDLKLSIRPPDIEDVSLTQSLDFNNKVKPKTLETSRFDWAGLKDVYLKDDGGGNVNIYRLNAGVEIGVNDSVGNIKVAGSINYTTGLLSFDKTVFDVLDIQEVYGESIHFNIYPILDDIVSDREKVLVIDTADAKIFVEDIVTGIIT